MKEFLKKNRTSVILLAVAAVISSAAAVLRLIFRGRPDAVTEYFLPFSQDVLYAVGRLWQWVPFTFTELLVIIGGIGLIVLLIITLTRAIRRKTKLFWLIRTLSIALVAASALYLMFYGMWGENYYSTTLAEKLGLYSHERSVEDLITVTNIVIARSNAFAAQVERDGTGQVKVKFADSAEKAVDAYALAGKDYPIFDHPVNRAKYLLSSKLFSYMGISGIFIPFTAESNVSITTPPVDISATICHEMAHSLGIAREDEANFASYLVCGYGDAELKYSGEMLALIYCLNSVYSSARDRYSETYSSLSDIVRNDLKYRNQILKQYESPLEKIATKSNHSYLRAMGQDDGVKSYGRMVDLLLAYYLDNN